MTAKNKRIIMFVAPVIIAGAIIFYLNRKKKKPAEPATDADVQVAAPAAASTVASVFPLKQGSRGEKVKELQRIIGVDPDGIFGPMTENALITFGGTRTVSNQKELDDLAKKAIGISGQARAKDLVAKFQAGGLSMYVITTTIAEQIVTDVFGATQATGARITLAGGKVYNNTDYVLTTWTKLGKLVFVITKGALAGQYTIDPNQVSLK